MYIVLFLTVLFLILQVSDILLTFHALDTYPNAYEQNKLITWFGSKLGSIKRAICCVKLFAAVVIGSFVYLELGTYPTAVKCVMTAVDLGYIYLIVYNIEQIKKLKASN